MQAGPSHPESEPGRGGSTTVYGGGRPHVVDFGLAKLVATASKLTKAGEALGTPAYMSPEQARGELTSLAPATDVWSVGCVLYEMLVGRRSFEGETDAAVVGKVLLAEPPRLRTLRGDVPEGVERIVRVCLGKRVVHRYRDAAALRDDLDLVLRGERPRARLPGARRWKAAAALLASGVAAWGAVAVCPRAEAPAPPSAASAPSALEAPAVSPVERLGAKARALRQTDPRRAAEILREALEREPARDDLRIERGLLLWAVGENAGAREEWGRVPSGSSEGPRGRLFQGLEAVFRMAADEARPHLVALRDAPGRVGSLARGAILLMGRDWRLAREALSGAEGWEAHLLRGLVESVDPAGDRAAELREYGSALDSGIPFAWAWYNRGVVNLGLGDLAGAMVDFDRALDLNPRITLAWYNRGVAKQALGDLAGAVADWDHAIELNAQDARTWNNRGVAKRVLGDLSGAVADYDRALELDPQHAEVWCNRGSAKEALGDLAGAAADWERALDVAPTGWPHRAQVEMNLAEARARLATK
ncbi:MAG: tetratricopeptide repeat-containing serine/threonine-protein kinase [Planctomycetales bacterium]|nr:tetratricopeptide repeat-containing serine/threonine-protein kinase [Planctomycetales bacterium]